MEDDGFTSAYDNFVDAPDSAFAPSVSFDDSDPAYQFIDSTPSGLTGSSGSSTSVVPTIASLGSAFSSILGGVGSVIKASNSAPTVGSYTAAGQFVPLANSSGIISVPGQTTAFGTAATNALSGVGSTVSSALGSLSPYMSYIVIGLVLFFVFKLFKKL